MRIPDRNDEDNNFDGGILPRTNSRQGSFEVCSDGRSRRVGLKLGFGAQRRRFNLASLAAVLSLIVAGGLGERAQAADAASQAPGVGSSWTTGAKEGIGTSTTNASKIWYAIGQGITHEVYFPRIDNPNVQDLQYIVTDGASFVDLERDATNHDVLLLNTQALSYRQINTAKSGRYRITKTYVSDVNRPTLLVETRFQVLSGGPYRLYVLYNPSINGTGMGDIAETMGNVLVTSDGPVASALAVSSGFIKTSNGYSGTASDGLADLQDNKQLDQQFDQASAQGNIVQIGEISVGSDTTFTLALGFGATGSDAVANANASLATNFATHRASYESGWLAYLAPLTVPNSVAGNPNLENQYKVALMTLKAHEDKTFPGASIASLTIPWGQSKNADFCCVAEKGGYQAVWARDLYQVATAQMAAGDVTSANNSLDYLLNVQQLGDGSFPHNSRVDGSPVPGINCGFDCQQLDEAAFPIILAHQLGRSDAATWVKVEKAADFIVAKGPFTPQERWEEERGFSPSTIAAEIAALVCAADIAQKNGNASKASTYLAAADNWQQNIENWTFTTNGPHGNHRYYIRIDDNQNPNDGHSIDINNGGGAHNEQAILDQGFLELVRLGVKSPYDPHILDSLSETDATTKVVTPNGDMFHRYNHDGYGEQANGEPFLGAGVGRAWPILNGERGEFELARGNSATSFLEIMAKSAGKGFMLPEQIWDQSEGFGKFTFGKGTDSATPLAWSMAQFVRLALSIDAGRPVETPKIVADRYIKPGTITFNVTVPAGTPSTGKDVFIAGEINRLDPSLPLWNPGGVKMDQVDATHWTKTIDGREGTLAQYKYVLGDWPFVEESGTCDEIANRSVTLAFGSGTSQTVNDTVTNWRNVAPCGN